MAEPLGTGLRGPDQYSPVIQQAMQEQQRLGRQLEDTYAGEERRLTERRAQTAPVYESIKRELDQPAPQVPQTQDVPQFQPKEISSSDMQGFAMIAMAFAALGTKAMRGDITMAMNAASGAIKGFNEGALEQSALEMRQFDEKVKSVVAQNRQLMDKYNAVMESRKYSLQQKMQLLTVMGHENQDEAMIAAMKTGRLEHALQRNQQLLTHSENLQMRADQIKQAHEDRIAARQQAHEDRMAVLDVTRFRAGMGGTGAAAGAPRQLSEDANQYIGAYLRINGRMPIGLARPNPMNIPIIEEMVRGAKAAGMNAEQFATAGPIRLKELAALGDFEKMTNRVQAFENMLELNINVAEDLLKKVEPRLTEMRIANKTINQLRMSFSDDPQIAEYLYQVESVVLPEVGRILDNPNLTGELHVNTREDMKKFYSGDLPPQAQKAIFERARADARNRRTAYDTQRQTIIKRIETGNTPSPSDPKLTPQEQQELDSLRKRFGR